jgi:hypothetical protein
LRQREGASLAVLRAFPVGLVRCYPACPLKGFPGVSAPMCMPLVSFETLPKSISLSVVMSVSFA